MRLAVIPARGGSKGLPGKNIKMLNGKPLLAWSIESALESELVDRVVVSTDSLGIKEVAVRFGAEVMDRPSELATDEATTIAVLQHIANEIEDATEIIVLQPTSPLRDKGLLDECIRMFEEGGYSNLATGFWCKYQEFGSHNNMRRQDYKGFFYDDGNVYVLSRELVLTGQWSGNNPCKYPIAKHMNFEIDDAVDFVVLEALMKTYKR